MPEDSLSSSHHLSNLLRTFPADGPFRSAPLMSDTSGLYILYPAFCPLFLQKWTAAVVSLQRLAAKLTWRLLIGLGRGRNQRQVDDYLPVGNLFCSQHWIRNNPSELKVQKISLFRVEMELGTNCCFNLFFLACFGNFPAPGAFILRCGSAVFKDGLCLFDDLFSPKRWSRWMPAVLLQALTICCSLFLVLSMARPRKYPSFRTNMSGFTFGEAQRNSDDWKLLLRLWPAANQKIF